MEVCCSTSGWHFNSLIKRGTENDEEKSIHTVQCCENSLIHTLEIGVNLTKPKSRLTIEASLC